MKKRLIEFLAYLGIGQTKFEERVGLSRGLINNIKGDISLKTLKKIMITYPELNENWLKTGEGKMLNNIQGNSNFQQGENISYRHEMYPETIAENSKNYQEIIMKSQRQIDEFQKIIINQQEQVNKLIGIIEQFNKK
jgi:hypothetical protein